MARSQDGTSSNCAGQTAVLAPRRGEMPRSKLSSRDSRPILICDPHRAARLSLRFDGLGRTGRCSPFEFNSGSIIQSGMSCIERPTQSFKQIPSRPESCPVIEFFICETGTRDPERHSEWLTLRAWAKKHPKEAVSEPEQREPLVSAILFRRHAASQVPDRGSVLRL